jgi:lysozyme
MKENKSNRKRTKGKASKRKKKSSRKGRGWSRIILFLLFCLIAVSLVLFCSRTKIGETFVRWSMGRETPFVPHKYIFDGALFIGEIKHNQPDGPGIMQLEGGTVLAGTWKVGKKEGIFRESDTQGKSTFTLWENDVCVGKAKTLNYIRKKDKKLYEKAKFGIDVSKYQPEYWGAMAICVNSNGSLASNSDVEQWIPIDFVILKATEGKTIIDRQYQYHSEMADILDIPQGAYHVISTKSDVYDQVELYLKQIEEVKLDFPPILDIEGSTKEISPEQFKENEALYIEWLDQVEQFTGLRPMIYCCYDFYMAYGRNSKLKQYDFWIAAYNLNDFPASCRLRQISETGRIAGWKEKVDIDVLLYHNNK